MSSHADEKNVLHTSPKAIVNVPVYVCNCEALWNQQASLTSLIVSGEAWFPYSQAHVFIDLHRCPGVPSRLYPRKFGLLSL